jgi:hypothetical protein
MAKEKAAKDSGVSEWPPIHSKQKSDSSGLNGARKWRFLNRG